MKFKVTKKELEHVIKNYIEMRHLKEYFNGIELEGEPVEEKSNPLYACPTCDEPYNLCKCDTQPQPIEELNLEINRTRAVDEDGRILYLDEWRYMLTQDKLNEVIRGVNKK